MRQDGEQGLVRESGFLEREILRTFILIKLFPTHLVGRSANRVREEITVCHDAAEASNANQQRTCNA